MRVQRLVLDHSDDHNAQGSSGDLHPVLLLFDDLRDCLVQSVDRSHSLDR